MSAKQDAMFALLESKEAGQNVSAFCKEHHISEASFYYWQKKSREVLREETAAGFAAVEWTATAGNPVAIVQLSGGAVITLYHVEGLSYLQSLL
jgi:hypothetical protein